MLTSSSLMKWQSHGKSLGIGAFLEDSRKETMLLNLKKEKKTVINKVNTFFLNIPKPLCVS